MLDRFVFLIFFITTFFFNFFVSFFLLVFVVQNKISVKLCLVVIFFKLWTNNFKLKKTLALLNSCKTNAVKTKFAVGKAEGGWRKNTVDCIKTPDLCKH